MLSHQHYQEVSELLAQDSTVNLFLIGWLRSSGMSRAPWYGYIRHGRLAAVALVVPERLVVPWAPEPEHAAAIGQELRHTAQIPGMLIGPREASDALWHAWAPGRARLWFEQRLYVQNAAPLGPRVEGFRAATLRDLPALIIASARMEEEDLHQNPLQIDPVGHEAATRERIRSGRTWVIEREGEIVFHIHAGTWQREGCQVGGTYVPPALRGQGIGISGMCELGRALLLESAGRYPPASEYAVPSKITLHVNEANTRAIRTYEAAGYQRSAPFRLAALARETP